MSNRIIDLRDPDDYIPFDEYEKHEQLYNERLKAKASELQAYADSRCNCLTIKYREPEHLGVKNPCITVLKDGKYIASFTDGDKAENKVKEIVDRIMNTNASNTVKLSESQLRKIVAESLKSLLGKKENIEQPRTQIVEKNEKYIKWISDSGGLFTLNNYAFVKGADFKEKKWKFSPYMHDSPSTGFYAGLLKYGGYKGFFESLIDIAKPELEKIKTSDINVAKELANWCKNNINWEEITTIKIPYINDYRFWMGEHKSALIPAIENEKEQTPTPKLNPYSDSSYYLEETTLNESRLRQIVAESIRKALKGTLR